MTPKHIPMFGYSQPTYGDGVNLKFLAVNSATTKRPKFIATTTRRTIARQIRARMIERYPDAGDKVKALAEEAGTSLSTIQRALDPDRYSTGITIDVLTQIAMALRCEPEDLLRKSG